LALTLRVLRELGFSLQIEPSKRGTTEAVHRPDFDVTDLVGMPRPAGGRKQTTMAARVHYAAPVYFGDRLIRVTEKITAQGRR
jgi:hypothetical protein